MTSPKVKQPKKFDFPELSGAEEQEEDVSTELPPSSHKNTAQKSSLRKQDGGNVSIMSEDTLVRMKKLLKQLGKDDDDHASESSSDGDSMSDGSSAESELEDMFRVGVLPRSARTWMTEQDEELERIARLAACLRDQPLLPADPSDPQGVRSFEDLELLDAGIHLPFSHCGFKNCK